MDRRKIITPREAIAHAVIRPRNAPRANPSIALSGWVEWTLVDRRGRERAGGASHNMWLDQGLDAIGTVSGAGGMFGWSSSPNKIMQGLPYAAVGTGSAAADPTDTALDNEIARVNTMYDNGSITNNSPGVYTLSKTFLFDYGDANGNLTEWGVAGASSGQLRTRALFLDGAEQPITVTKTSDYQLRLTYSCQLTLTPVALTPASLTIAGIGTLNGDVALCSAGSSRDFFFFTALAAGWLGYAVSLNNQQAGIGLSTDDSWSYGGNLSASGSDRAQTGLAASTYVGGSYQRTYSGSFGPANGNQAGIRQLLGTAAGTRAFTFLIDAGDAFTKTNENILSLTDFITVTWARG